MAKKTKAAKSSEETELEELIDDVVSRLSVSNEAADIMANLSGERAHALMHDRPLVSAAHDLWKKAKPDHEVAKLLAELNTELARHDEAIRKLGLSFERLVESDSVEVEPDEDDQAAIAQVIEDDQAHDHGDEDDEH